MSPRMVFGGLRRAHPSPNPPNRQIADDVRLQWGNSLLDCGRRRAAFNAHTIPNSCAFSRERLAAYPEDILEKGGPENGNCTDTRRDIEIG